MRTVTSNLIRRISTTLAVPFFGPQREDKPIPKKSFPWTKTTPPWKIEDFGPWQDWRMAEQRRATERLETQLSDRLNKIANPFNLSVEEMGLRLAAPNLTALEAKALAELKKDPHYIYVKADKDRAFVKLEIQDYIARAYEHLNSPTYEYVGGIDSQSATVAVAQALTAMSRTVDRFPTALLPKRQADWLKASVPVMNIKDIKLPKFRLLIKTHKTPWSTRPIVGAHSWITKSWSEFLQQKLQPMVKRMVTKIPDTDHLITSLRKLNGLNLNWNEVSISAADVTAMYPSINTAWGLKALHKFFRLNGVSNDLAKGYTAMAEVVLRHQLLRFGNKVFRQKEGTAMGTNFAPEYAYAVFYIIERNILHPHESLRQAMLFDLEDDERDFDKKDETDEPRLKLAKSTPKDEDRPLLWRVPGLGILLFYGRFIDDMLLIKLDAFSAAQSDKIFRNLVKEAGPLRLDAFTFQKQIAFLDLDISVTPQGLEWKMFEKSMVTHLYLPPFSQHPPSVMKSWTKQEMIRILKRNSKEVNYLAAIRTFLLNLQKRGFEFAYLSKLWNDRPVFRERTYYENPPPKIQDQTINVPIEYNRITANVNFKEIITRAVMDTKAEIATNALDKLAFRIAWKTASNLEKELMPSHDKIAKAQPVPEEVSPVEPPPLHILAQLPPGRSRVKRS